MSGQARKSLQLEKCLFCSTAENNELLLGAKKRLEDVVTHYYCLLLSSNMEQKGEDSEGLLGFMLPDIRKELSRGSRLTCTYCKKLGATINCKQGKCKKIFHLPCGIKEGSLHQFFGQFKSFCPDHRPAQRIPPKVLREMCAGPVTTCAICYEDVPQKPSRTTLWAPCCKKGAWFHRECVQKLANSAGYFFKCPLCNNKEEFGKAMQDCGIYIPEQDASWETVPNAYEELLHRHDQCDHPHCSDPKGRRNDEKHTRWELVLCDLCGSQGVHIKCGALSWANPEWECAGCQAMLEEAEKRRIADASTANIAAASEPSVSRPPSTSPCPSPPQLSPNPAPSRSSSPPWAVELLPAKTALQEALEAPRLSPAVQPILPTATTRLSSPGPSAGVEAPAGTTSVRGQRARRGGKRRSANLGDRTVVQPQPAVVTGSSAEVIEILTDSDDEIQIIDEAPALVASTSASRGLTTELVTSDGSKIQVVQVKAKESRDEVAEGDVKVGQVLSLFKSRASLTVTTLPPVKKQEDEEDEVVYIDTTAAATESKYSVGVMKLGVNTSQRGNRSLPRSRRGSAAAVAGTVPQASAGLPRRSVAQPPQQTGDARATQSPQRLVPRTSLRPNNLVPRSDKSASLIAQQKPSLEPLQTSSPGQQFTNKSYTMTSDQSSTAQMAASSKYDSAESPSPSPKRSRLAGRPSMERRGSYRQDYGFSRADDGRPAHPPSYEEATSQAGEATPAQCATMLGYQNVPLYNSVGGYVASGGPDSPAGMVLQPGTTYVAVGGNAQPQFQGFVVTSQSTVIPTNYVMNTPTGQPTSVGGASSQYDCCFQRTNANGPDTASGNTATAKDSAAADSSASAASVAGHAAESSEAASARDETVTGDEAPGWPTEPRCGHNRLMDYRSFTFKVNGPKCINAMVDSSVTHIPLTMPKKAILIPVLPTVHIVRLSAPQVSAAGKGPDHPSPSDTPGSADTARARRNRKQTKLGRLRRACMWKKGVIIKNTGKRRTATEGVRANQSLPRIQRQHSTDGTALTDDATSAVNVAGPSRPPQKTSGKSSRSGNKKYYYYKTEPAASEQQSCAKYAMSDKTAFNTRSKKMLANARSTRSTVSLKEYNFLEGSENYVPIFKHAEPVAKPSVTAKGAKPHAAVSTAEANGVPNDKLTSSLDRANSSCTEQKQKEMLLEEDLKNSALSRSGDQQRNSSGRYASPIQSCGSSLASGSSSLASGSSSLASRSSSLASRSSLLASRSSSFASRSSSLASRSSSLASSSSSLASGSSLLASRSSSLASRSDGNAAGEGKRSGKRLRIADFVLTSAEKELREQISDSGSGTETEETYYTAVTMRPPSKRREPVHLRLSGKRPASPDQLPTVSGSSDRLCSDESVSKTMEASDYSDDNFEDENVDDEDDEIYIKKAMMKYSHINNMSTMKAKTLTARKFLPSSRTEELQRERIKTMKRLPSR